MIVNTIISIVVLFLVFAFTTYLAILGSWIRYLYVVLGILVTTLPSDSFNKPIIIAVSSLLAILMYGLANNYISRGQAMSYAPYVARSCYLAYPFGLLLGLIFYLIGV